MTEPTEKELDNFEQELMMEEQDELALALLIDSVPSAGKCEHGVYIAKGDTFAHYCTACNPGVARIMRPPMRVALATKQERTLDLAEFFEQPLFEYLRQIQGLLDVRSSWILMVLRFLTVEEHSLAKTHQNWTALEHTCYGT